METPIEFFRYISTQTFEPGYNDEMVGEVMDERIATLQTSLTRLFSFMQQVAPSSKYFETKTTYTVTDSDALSNTVKLPARTNSVNHIFLNGTELNYRENVEVEEGYYRFMANSVAFKTIKAGDVIDFYVNTIPRYSKGTNQNGNTPLSELITPSVPSIAIHLLANFYIDNVVNSKNKRYNPEEKQKAFLALENEKNNLTAILKNRVSAVAIPNRRRIITNT